MLIVFAPPPVINSLYTVNSDIHEHNTRQKHILHTNECSTNQFNKCFSNISARVWNALQKTHTPHHQSASCKAAIDADPPYLNPVHYGWNMDATYGKFVLVTLLSDVSPTHLDVMTINKCGYSYAPHCLTCAVLYFQPSCSTFFYMIAKMIVQ